MMRIAFGLVYFGLCLVSVKAQIIEISRELIHVDDDVTLKCLLPDNVANTKDVSNYIWYLNKKKISSTEHFEQRDNELKIKNIAKHLEGYYSCLIEFRTSGMKLETLPELIIISENSHKVENHDKLDSPCSFRIPKLCRNKRNKNEEGRLKFTVKPLSKNVDLGTSSKVHCKAPGSTRIYWMKDSDDRLPNDVEDNNGTLIISDVKFEHRGNYTCVASNDEESIKTTIEIRILPKFEIIPPKSLEVVELQSVYLDCVASGSPPPTIKWDHESTIISTNEGDDGRFKIFENGTLLLHEARQDDAGIYGCFIGSSAAMDSHSSFEDANQEGGFIMSKAVLMTCLVALIYISLVVALMLWCRNKRQKSRLEDPENKDVNDDTASDGDDGRGEFGEVLTGAMLESDVPSNSSKSSNRENKSDVNEIKPQHRLNILVKSLSNIKSEIFFVEFRRQVDLYRAVDSQHVIKLFALCFEKDRHFMILEHGQELKTFLTNEQAKLTPQMLLKFSRGISCAVDLIAKLKWTHRDIALRNCIITHDSIVKLSTISLCKDKHANEYFKQNNKMIPLSHLAPEVIESSLYSTASDVYALGITLWEILNEGLFPFENITGDEFLQLKQNNSVDYQSLFNNEKVPKELQKVLLECWSSLPNERPKPENVIKLLDDLIGKENNCVTNGIEH
ncbi:CLUMA_CG014489, isoform A [Clunio marinus]|uniref:CLUMA_CG014489, isoform A n=1 Tax=Clunio marinus TaxID=568069 RepID=A0A1J1IM08_9DIPT|nr:CLUMA_CG014489, isoform A [Clunio marinus]